MLFQIRNLKVLPQSVVETEQAIFGLDRFTIYPRLVILLKKEEETFLSQWEGEKDQWEGHPILICPANAKHAKLLQTYFPWLCPKPVGLRTSAGLGDRLGLATPGHIQAIRATGEKLMPVLAQQSIREMSRTQRTPEKVLEDAVWGVFAEGWKKGFGSDADHLKTLEDFNACIGAGFNGFTLDPGDHVENEAESLPPDILSFRFETLPWDKLEDSPKDFLRRYRDRTFSMKTTKIRMEEEELAKTLVKYGKAIAQVKEWFYYLKEKMEEKPFDLEISVDETQSPTSPEEHLIVALELSRLGVKWQGLAPRFIGRFEKGVDYIGDLEAFRRDFTRHAAVAQEFGPYKLSLHSGSDKFSIYPIAAEETHGLVHLKTAGTSYLEALRAIVELDPPFFRSIYAFACERYETDRASYHVSAEVAKAPDINKLSEVELLRLLDDFYARQILHVTFGSVVTAQFSDGRFQFRDRMLELLNTHLDLYTEHVKSHFIRHLTPFAEAAQSSS